MKTSKQLKKDLMARHHQLREAIDEYAAWRESRLKQMRELVYGKEA